MNLKDNTTSVKDNIKKQNNNLKKNMNRFKHKKKFSNDIPYTVHEVEKSINYIGSTCGYYAYANALKKYLVLLRQYKSGHLRYPPRYPDLCDYQPDPPKTYKRPYMYQGVGKTPSPTLNLYAGHVNKVNTVNDTTDDVSLKYDITPDIKKEKSILYDVPDEIITLIK